MDRKTGIDYNKQNTTIRDLFHVYLKRYEFHFLRLHINKKNFFFAFSCITDVSLVLPNRQDGNFKHGHNTVALNTSPSPCN